MEKIFDPIKSGNIFSKYKVSFKLRTLIPFIELPHPELQKYNEMIQKISEIDDENEKDNIRSQLPTSLSNEVYKYILHSTYKVQAPYYLSIGFLNGKNDFNTFFTALEKTINFSHKHIIETINTTLKYNANKKYGMYMFI